MVASIVPRKLKILRLAAKKTSKEKIPSEIPNNSSNGSQTSFPGKIKIGRFSGRRNNRGYSFFNYLPACATGTRCRAPVVLVSFIPVVVWRRSAPAWPPPPVRSAHYRPHPSIFSAANFLPPPPAAPSPRG